MKVTLLSGKDEIKGSLRLLVVGGGGQDFVVVGGL